MTRYAQFDSTVTGPTPVVAWYDTDFATYTLPDAADLLEIDSDTAWNNRFATPYVSSGGLVAAPAPTATQLAAQAQAALVSQAQGALSDSDTTVVRCVSAGVTIPAAWQTYRVALRAIVNGTDTTSTALPAKPAYPAGT